MSRSRAGLLALFAASLSLYLTPALRFGFDGLYGQDAYAYLDYARGPLTTRLFDPGPLPPFFWPPGYPLLVALIGLWADPLRAALGMSLVAGALVPPLIVLLGHALWPGRPRVGWIAGALAAPVPQLWQSSAVAMADTTALAAGTLGAIALVRYTRAGGARRFALGAGAVSFAVLTRWAYALVAIPMVLLVLHATRRMERPVGLRHLVVGAVVTLLVLSPVLGAALGSHGADSTLEANLAIHRWNPAAAFRTVHESSEGTLRYRLPNGVWYAIAPARVFFFTPLVALFLLPGVAAEIRARDPARLIVLLGWPLSLYLWHSGDVLQNFRFTLAALSPLALLAALGIVQSWERLSGWVRLVPLSLLLAGLVWMVASGLTLTGSFVARKAESLETVRWVEAQLDDEARLLTFGLTQTADTYTSLDVRDLFSLTPDGVDRIVAQPPTYLLVDGGSIERQWRGRSPDIIVRYLLDRYGLEEVGERPPYTLYRVGLP